MKRGRAIASVVLLAVIVVAAFFALRPREPVYQGKQLSQWLEEFNRVGPAEINQEAEKAIRQIGTNALPFLVKDLCSRDSPFKLSLMKLSMKWSPIKFHFRPAEDRHGPARMGFYVLGTAGKLGPAAIPFLPALGKLLKTEPYGAALALLYCGEESIPYLTDSLSDSNRTVRVWAAVALEKLSLDANKRGFGFGLWPSSYSGRSIFSPSFSFSDEDVPAFVNNLRSTNSLVRAATGEAIGEIRITAWNSRIVPVLLPLLNDDDIRVRNAAAQALKRIDPEAATKAGVK